MSTWRDQLNAHARARLERAGSEGLPRVVFNHACAQALTPPLPRLAVDSYWRAHPIRADRLARALAVASGAPDKWVWRLDSEDGAIPRSLRIPPAPYRETAHDRGSGFCCICGQPVFRFGWHADLCGSGRVNVRAAWHACCVVAWKLWIAPQTHYRTLSRLQARRCAITGKRLLRGSEIDHRIPLFRVWRDHRAEDWAGLLKFWGFPNLQALSRSAHRSKTIDEAGDRVSKDACSR